MSQPEFPAELIFTLSYRCNLRCQTCYLFLEDGKHVAPQIRDDLPAGRWQELLDEAAAFSPKVYFVGGEPLIFKGILELVAHSVRRGLYTYLCTNGTMLKRVAGPLVATGLDRVEISLDGLEETHDWIRGPGVYQRTLQGIEALLRARKQSGSDRPRIGLAVLMCHHNVEHLLPVYEKARELGLDFLKYQYMMFNERGNVARDRQLFRECFGVESTVMEGYLDILEQDLDADRLQQVVEQLLARPGTPEVTFFPEVSRTREFYQDLGHVFPRSECRFPERTMRILPNGDVPVCFGHPDFSAGNVREQGLLEVFRGEVLSRFRQVLAEQGLFPGCLRCSQRSYGEGQQPGPPA